MPRVFVVSPLPAVRAGLRSMLGSAAGLKIVGEGRTSHDPAALEADVVVLDGESVPHELEPDLGAADQPGPGLVILGPVPGDGRLAAQLAGRAWAYLPRDASADQLIAAVQAVASGLLAIDPLLGGHLFARHDLPITINPDADQDLTAREREVLQLVALGLANKTIARRLAISEHTVKFHVAALLSKLNAASRTEAVHQAARRGLVAL